jgi:hypothetical protein
LKLNGLRRLLVYTDDINILGGSIHIIMKKNTEALIVASEETGLEVNAEKTKYVFMSQEQRTGKNHNIKLGNTHFARVEQINYLETAIKNQNSIHEEIKSRLKSENACYHSVQNILSSTVLSKNIRINICRIIILHVVLYGCKTWSLTWREGHRLRLFENRGLRKTFGTRRDEVTWEWRRLHNEELYDL